ncbi:MAG TPA: VWA domain-containing protein [Pseudomonadales bacterium]|nr:VWA domain-containing protein [Pseudomonadales bacterium]
MSWMTFHFLYPLWFLALLPAVFFIWRFIQEKAKPNFWADKVDSHLLAHLLVKEGGRTSYLGVYVLGLAWLLAVCALANPVWEKKPQANFQGESALVIALDLSRSMDVDDVKPSRLKAIKDTLMQQLSSKRNARVALVVFAEHAFVAAPLSLDASTAINFIQSADTRIMPTQGSRPDRALSAALELLQQAKQTQAQVLLITDGAYDKDALRESVQKLRQQNYVLTIVAVGTQAGGDVHLPANPSHGLMTTSTVNASLDNNFFSSVAQESGALYFLVDKPIEHQTSWIRPLKEKVDESARSKQKRSIQWVEKGPYLLALLVPLVAFGFRRGWLGMWCITCLFTATLLTPGHELHAEEMNQTQKIRVQWFDLWLRPDYQAYAMFKRGELQQAAEKFSDPSWQAAAWYRLGVFDKAAAAYGQLDTAEAHFNRGNALVQQGKLEEALAAYNSALEKNIEFRDASFNRQLVTQYLQASRKKDSSSLRQQQSPQHTEKENSVNTEKTKQPANKARAAREQESDKKRSPNQVKKDQAEAQSLEGDQGKALAQNSTNKSHNTETTGAYRKSAAYEFKEKNSIGPAQWLNMIEDKPNELLRLKFAFMRDHQEPKPEDGPEPW